MSDDQHLLEGKQNDCLPLTPTEGTCKRSKKSVLEINLDYAYKPFNQALRSISSSCKARVCRVQGIPNNVETIYDRLDTSCTTFESLSICNICRDQGNSAGSFDVNIEFIFDKYYAICTTFGLHRGLYCNREKFNSNRGTSRYVDQHEISLYKNAIQAIYYMERKIDEYDEKKVQSRYTLFEWHIILPDLLTSLVLGILSYNEENYLMELLKRDPICNCFLEKISIICSSHGFLSIKPLIDDFGPIYIIKPTPLKILREFVCMFLSVLMVQVLQIFKGNINIIFRSVSDYRFIFELDANYSVVQMNISFKSRDLGETVFHITSDRSIDILPKYFNRGVLKVGKN